MAKENALRVGIIGPGGMGRHRVREFAQRDDCQIVAYADISETPMDLTDKYVQEGVPSFDAGQVHRYLGEYAFIDMLNKEKLDIACVYTPHSLHAEQCRTALRFGAHVAVEKPFANLVGDAIHVAQLAKARDRHMIIQYQRHFEPIYVTGRKVLREGIIGEIQEFEVFLAQNWSGFNWRGDLKFSGGGQPNDSGSHLQDILLWMTGLLPKEITGSTSKLYKDKDGNVIEKQVEIDSESDITMENGAKGKLTILGNTTIGFEEWIVLKGTEGTLTIKEGKLLLSAKGQDSEIPQDRPEGYPQSNIDNLVKLIRGQISTNFVSSINGVRTSWLTNSILEAGRGPEKRNTVSCDRLLEVEGYSRQYVKDKIAEYEKAGCF
ncbi:MAG TPA: Gfo/Idh/MocA family oxidoreductase [Armatimonadota bacterium]|jgi:predicted dehydrogenase